MALSQREKLLLAVPAALGAMLAFYTYVHEPLFARRAEAAANADQVAAELRRDQARLMKEGNLEARDAAVTAREQVVDAWVPGKNSAALFIWYLSQAERHSGARIKNITVSEKKQVAAAPEAQQGAEASGDQAGAAPEQSAVPTLTVVGLDIRAEARFAEHLLFNQALEEMPLFLNTKSLALARDESAVTERAAKYLEDGNSWLAAQILKASPNLDGTYHIDLYFKGDKVGPTADVMKFGQEAGRVDPFVMVGVDEFLRVLTEYYNSQRAGNGENPGEGRGSTGSTGGQPGQLG